MQVKSEKNLELVARLLAAREKRRLTQADVASLWGISGNYVYLVESCKKPFSKKLIQKLAELEAKSDQKLDEHQMLKESPPPYQTRARLYDSVTGEPKPDSTMADVLSLNIAINAIAAAMNRDQIIDAANRIAENQEMSDPAKVFWVQFLTGASKQERPK